MKKKLALRGFLVLGLALAGCSGVIDEPAIDVRGGSMPPRVGETLEAISSGAEFTGNSDFIWEYSSTRVNEYWEEIRVNSYYYRNLGTLRSENDRGFTIGKGLAHYYLRVKRKTKDKGDVQGIWVYSDIIGRIQPAGQN